MNGEEASERRSDMTGPEPWGYEYYIGGAFYRYDRKNLLWERRLISYDDPEKLVLEPISIPGIRWTSLWVAGTVWEKAWRQMRAYQVKGTVVEEPVATPDSDALPV